MRYDIRKLAGVFGGRAVFTNLAGAEIKDGSLILGKDGYVNLETGDVQIDFSRLAETKTTDWKNPYLVISRKPYWTVIFEASFPEAECFYPGNLAEVLIGSKVELEIIKAEDPFRGIDIRMEGFYEELIRVSVDESNHCRQVELVPILWERPELYAPDQEPKLGWGYRLDKQVLPEEFQANRRIKITVKVAAGVEVVPV